MKTYTITNIRAGTWTQEKPYGGRQDLLYANLRDDKGDLLISATLDFIVADLKRRLALELEQP